MICPRCSVAEISAETNRCVLCGYAPSGGGGGTVGVQVEPREELLDHVLRELEQQFQIERLLSKGPRTLVYAAREVETERKVALKVLSRQPVREAGMEDRFTRDAAAAASLDHPHIVPIYRFGATAHLLWYSMKFIEGRSLSEILRVTGPLELHACLRIVEQIASALQYAHRRGITHGDIRPGNVMVDAQEWALVTDFAIGRVLERIASGPGDDSPARPPEYVAPEESYARQPGPGADQYALAVLVYEILAGQRPARPPQPLVAVRPEIPVPFAEALLRAMHAQPTARFMNVMELVSVLGAGDPALVPAPRATPRPSANQRVLFVDGPARSRRWLWMGVGAAVGLTAVGLAALQIVNTPTASSPIIDMPTEASPTPTAVPPPPASAPPLLSAPPPAPARTSPSPVPRQPTSRPTAPPRVAQAPGHLFINSTPWGQLYVDGELVGTTPLADFEIPAGIHRLRVVRQGFQAFDLEIEVAPGQQVRLTDIVLQQGPP